jgi:ankyrin repeat protein
MGPDEFFEKVNQNDIRAVKEALARDPSLANAREAHLGSRPLHHAAHRGFTGIVEAVLEAGGDIRARESVSDTTPLHWAAEGGHRAIARMLIERGADLEAVDEWFRLSPLGWATVVTWNPAFHEDRPATAAALLEAGARLDLFSALALGKAGAMREIAAADPASLERRLGYAADTMTPLQVAVSRRLTEMARQLLDLGADPSARTAGGLTTLALARLHRDSEAATLFVARGAAPDLSSAMVVGDFAAMEARLRAGAGGGLPADQPGQLVFFAAQEGMAEALRILLDRGADPNRRARRLIGETPLHVTPLHLAAKGGHVTAARALLERRAISSPGAEDGTPTPLHLAAGAGHFDMVRFLIDAGADVNAREKGYNATPLDWGEHGGHAQVIPLLREAMDKRA